MRAEAVLLTAVVLHHLLLEPSLISKDSQRFKASTSWTRNSDTPFLLRTIVYFNYSKNVNGDWFSGGKSG